jgi:2-polyprenyl-6-hydroxyphenyl methylase/3-demethylubiquinone-9 3-methyltransferase
MRFAFGKNWEKFIRESFSEERVEISKSHFMGFLNLPDLRGKYFLDVGCGSGLHSLAAIRAGASRVVSFDFDQDAVNTARVLKGFTGDDVNWEIMQGSILDDNFLSTLEPADIVYSWGVLHHTGSMWKAFENTMRLMKDDGQLYIALYDDRPYFDRSLSFWLEVKQRYNVSNWFGKKKIDIWYFWEFFLQKKWSKLPALLKQAREYKKSRGMDMYRDAVDWLGGWPMEYASVEKVERFARDKLGLTLVNLKTGQANAEYLFVRPLSPLGPAEKQKRSDTPASIPSSDQNNQSTWTPVNCQARQSDPDSLARDLQYAIQVGQNFLARLSDDGVSVYGKTILEIGPGINFGSIFLMACMGAKVMVSDRFLTPWDTNYHSKFYSMLRDWIRTNYPSSDLTPLDRILSEGSYCQETLRMCTSALEELYQIPESSVDITLSNAVLEHVYNPTEAIRNLARISKPGAVGYHQVDFRDHTDFSKPLEFLLLEDEAFAIEFSQKQGECGNRYRPHEVARLFEESGFSVVRFSPSCFCEESYLNDFISRLRRADGSRYRDTLVEDLREIGGYYAVKRRPC